MNRERINTIIQSFKDYIPCTDGNITCFHAPYDCRVNFYSKENLVKSYTNFFNIFPSPGNASYYSLQTNGFIIKNVIEPGNETLKKDDLICITYEPFDRKIKRDIDDYFKLGTQIHDYEVDIEQVKTEFALESMGSYHTSKFYYALRTMFEDLYKNEEEERHKKLTAQIDKINEKINNTERLRATILEHLRKYRNNKIIELKEYL